MSQIDQRSCHNNTEIFVAEGSEAGCQVRLYSPHADMKMVIISGRHLFSDRFDPHRMIHIAHQAVRAFQLSPAQVVWIEHAPSSSDSPFCAVFHLLNFDWQGEQATSSYRSPIYEDWYFPALEAQR